MDLPSAKNRCEQTLSCMRRIFIAGIIFVSLVWGGFFWIARSAALFLPSIHCPCTGQVRSRAENGASQDLVVDLDATTVSLSMPNFPLVSIGDTIVFRGTFTPFTFDDPYHRTDLARGVRGEIDYPVLVRHIPLADFSLWFGFFRAIAVVQSAVLHILQQMPPPASSLAIGLVIGEKEKFSKVLRAAFRATGLTHVVAVSGTNVTLLLLFLQPLFLFLPRRCRFFAGFFCVISFVFVAGADPPVVRAALMGLIGFFAVSHSRVVRADRLLLFIFCVMAFWNPLQVVYDVSFQLSFAATAGLIFLSSWVESHLSFVPWQYLRQSFAVTLSAYITTLPFSIFVFHQLSWIAPFVNVLVEPIIPLAMGLVLVFLAVSFLCPPFAFLFGLTVYTLLHLLIMVILFLGQLSFVAFTWG